MEASPATTTPGQVRGFAALGDALTELSPAIVAYNLGYLALTWALAAGALTLAALAPSVWTIALAALLVSSRQQALLNVEHEAIHGKLVPSRRANSLIGRWLCAAPVGSPYSASSARHLSHHRLLGTPEDPDANLHDGEDKRTRAGLARHFAGGLVGAYAGMILMGPRAGESGSAAGRHDLISIAIAQLALGVVAGLLLGWWVYPALWLAPLLTVTVLFHLIRSFVEHAVTDDEAGDHANRLITIPSNPVERAIVAPYGMNYHAEHHLQPSVPAVRLRRLRARLAEREDRPALLERRSYLGALRDHFRALRG